MRSIPPKSCDLETQNPIIMGGRGEQKYSGKQDVVSTLKNLIAEGRKSRIWKAITVHRDKQYDVGKYKMLWEHKERLGGHRQGQSPHIFTTNIHGSYWQRFGVNWTEMITNGSGRWDHQERQCNLRSPRMWGFPGGSVAKTLHSQYRGPRFSPWSGN